MWAVDLVHLYVENVIDNIASSSYHEVGKEPKDKLGCVCQDVSSNWIHFVGHCHASNDCKAPNYEIL